MKRILALLLVFSLVFSMTACEDQQKEDLDKEEGKTPAVEDEKEDSEPEKEDDKSEKKDEGAQIEAEKLLQNIHARRAIAMSFDKSFITDFIQADGVVPVDYLIPIGLAFDASGADFRSKYPDGFLHYNVEEAKKEWEKAKEELGFDKIELEFLTFDAENSERIAEYIDSQLSTNLEGISIKLNQQPLKQKLELSKKGRYQLELSGWGPDYPDAMTFLDLFITGSGHNTCGYSNPEFDDVVERAKTKDLALDPAARWKALQEAEKLLLEDAVVIPIYQFGSTGLERPHLKGVLRHSFGTGYTYKNAITEIETDGKKIIRLLGGSDIPSMDTNKSTDQVSFEIMGNVLEGLVMLDEGDKVRPGIAEKWDVSEDLREYTFYLRDAVWSNDDPVTAQDFVDSWRRLANPETGSQYAYMVESAGLLNAGEVVSGKKPVEELGVEAVDEKTLKVTLTQPIPYFVKLMSFPSFYPINKKFVDEMGEDFGTSLDSVLFNGAYRLTQWDIGYGYGFRKNEKYWDAENVMNDGVDYRIVKDYSSAIALYDNGEIDKCALYGELVEQRKDSPDFKTYRGTAMYYLVLNVGNTGE